MGDLLRSIFWSDEFMPHGHCIQWKPGLVALHVASDGLIGTTYLVIAVVLWMLVRRTRIPFSPMILSFGLFIGACGLTHYLDILTLWVADYWLAGGVKAVTAVASVATAVYLVRSGPQIVGVSRGVQLSEQRRLEVEQAHRELEQAHQELERADRRHQRALRAQSECGQALVRSATEQALLDSVCRILVEVGGYRFTWVGLAESDDRKTVRPVAHAGYEESYLRFVDAVWSDTERGRGPSGTAIRTRQPVVLRDLRVDADFDPWREEALRRGYASQAALPLLAEGAVLGVLRLYAGSPGGFDDEELRLLSQLADDLAFGLSALRARAQRDQMTAQLMAADRLVSVGTLAAGVAHEINNPLSALLAGLDFVHEGLTAIERGPAPEQSEELHRALDESREAGRRIQHVARDLKTFSRGDHERREPIQLIPVLDSSISMASIEIKYRARLVRDFQPAPKVLASESRLGQVFLNLLINAAQAIPEGRVESNEIRVSTRTDAQGRAVIEFRDSGGGIPAEAAERIFEPFFTTKPIGVGTGLGLSICRNIVHAAGGEITVESEPGRGATFRIVLPPAPEAAVREGRSEPMLASLGRRGRVLVVDDEAAVATAVQRALRAEHEVTCLSSAVEARDRIRDGARFDVILCDLMMPRMTGMELHQEIATVAPEQAERMVFLSGGVFTPRAREFLDSVANARVDKPFEVRSLRVLVRGFVR